MVQLSAKNVSIAYPVIGRRVERGNHLEESSSGGQGDFFKKDGMTYVRAVKDFTVDLKVGDRLGIIGRNGSGKSTILRALAGIYPPTSGELKRVGRVSSLLNVGLGTRMESTGRRNIYLRGYMRGLSKEEIAAKEQAIIDFADIGDFIDMPVRSYSSGMAMRLSFSIATNFEPEILLLDEWIGVGDQDFQQKAKNRLLDLLSDSGITVLCSHNISIIHSTCNRVIWLDKGEIMRDGHTFDVIAQYEDWRRSRAVQ